MEANTTTVKPLAVWKPRYSRRDCIILAKKVSPGGQLYRIFFTEDKTYAGNNYIMTGDEIISNGSLEATKQGGKAVYAIPLHVLEQFKEVRID